MIGARRVAPVDDIVAFRSAFVAFKPLVPDWRIAEAKPGEAYDLAAVRIADQHPLALVDEQPIDDRAASADFDE